MRCDTRGRPGLRRPSSWPRPDVRLRARPSWQDGDLDILAATDNPFVNGVPELTPNNLFVTTAPTAPGMAPTFTHSETTCCGGSVNPNEIMQQTTQSTHLAKWVDVDGDGGA